MRLCRWGADQEHGLATDAINDRHGDHCEEQVGGADGDGLQITGDLGEAGLFENVVEVIEDGVDAAQLVEHADGDGKEDGEAVFPGKVFQAWPCSASMEVTMLWRSSS